jgi:hypothetical protein
VLDRLVLRAREEANVAKPLVTPLFGASRVAPEPAEMETFVPAAAPSARVAVPATAEIVHHTIVERVSDVQREPSAAARRLDDADDTTQRSGRTAAHPAAELSDTRVIVDRKTSPDVATSSAARPVSAPSDDGRTTPVPAPVRTARDPLLEQLYRKLDAARPSVASPVTAVASVVRSTDAPERPAHPVAAAQQHARPAQNVADAEPVVRVTIGQIVVRAVPPAAAPVVAIRPASPGSSLEEYLARGSAS